MNGHDVAHGLELLGDHRLDLARLRLREAEGALIPALFAYAATELGNDFFADAWEEFFCWHGVPDALEDSREFGTTFDPFFVFSFVPDSGSADLPEGWPAEPLALHVLHHGFERVPEFHREFIEQAAQADVDFLVFPEVSLHGYLMGSAKAQGSKEYVEQLAYFRSVAEPIPGPSTELLREYAAKYQMLIQAGLAERAMDGAVLYNSAVLVGPTGLLGVFRKVHNQFEWPVFRPGLRRIPPSPLCC